MKHENMNRACLAVAGSLLLWVAIPAPACEWTGTGSDDNWSTPANWQFCTGGNVPQNGDSLTFPGGAANKNSVNDIVNLTVGQITLTGWDYVISGQPVGLQSGVAVNLPTPSTGARPQVGLDAVLQGNQIFETIGVGELTYTGTIDLNGFDLAVDTGGCCYGFLGDLIGHGSLTLDGGFLGLTGPNSNYTGVTTVNALGFLTVGSDNGLGDSGPGNSTVVHQNATLAVTDAVSPEPISAAGTIQHHHFNQDGFLTGDIELTGDAIVRNDAGGGGTLHLTGTISGPFGLSKHGSAVIVLEGDNSYSGATHISQGALLINGNQSTGGGVLVSGGGVLGGIGTVNWIDSAPGGSVSPGMSPGMLTATGGVELGNASFLQIELQDPDPGNGHDQLVAGSADPSAFVSLAGLDGPELEVTADFNPPPGTEFTIIDNRTTNPVLGTFAGLPEGAMFAAGGLAFQISYSGGDGNDIVLSVVDDTLFGDRFEE